jgi:fucose 4-O-acetylase-like acetyltransferase
MKYRLDWLDAAKGLGMLLVMLGHTDIPTQLKTYIYTFHMPLFFFLSGYLFTLKKFPNLKVFLSKRTKSLILPYLCFSLIAYIWFIIIFHFGFVKYQENLFMPLIGSLVAIRSTVWTVHTGALWFIDCLFCTEVLFYFITKIGRKKIAIGIVLIFISVLGCFYNKLVGRPLPWSLDVTMISVGFYGAGFFYKEYRQKLDRFIKNKTFVCLITINIAAGYLNYIHSGTRVDLYNSSLGNIGLFYISAFSGIGAFIILIKRIKYNKNLQYIGENSLIYLSLHQKIVFFLFNLIIHNFLTGSDSIMAIPLVKGLLYTVIAAVALVPAVYSINHYFPFMLGKTKGRSNTQANFNG